MKVAVVDYGMCNLDSVRRAVEECGARAVVTDQAREIESADRIILPGVGAFADGMRAIRERSLDKILTEAALEKKRPFLGICLGMQMMGTRGFEGGDTEGLGWIEGEVRRLVAEDPGVRLPHVGWNEVNFSKESPLFRGISSGKDFYFVHSYSLNCKNESEILARAPYCGGFVCAVERGHLFGVQFHPEKSQRIGFQLLKNFLSIC